MDEIRERQSKRFQFLKLLYDEVNDFYAKAESPNQVPLASTRDLGNQLGFTSVETQQIVTYLHHEGLVKMVTVGKITIQHAGIKEVEEALSKPEKPTEHFPAHVTQYIINAQQITNSPIQQGTFGSTQSVSFSSDALQETSEFIELLKSHLSKLPLETEDRAEAEAEMATVQSQLSSPRPKSNIIRASIETIKNILENIPANVAANIIVANLPGLIDQASKLLQSLP